MPAKPRRSVSWHTSMVRRRRPGTAIRRKAGGGSEIVTFPSADCYPVVRRINLNSSRRLFARDFLEAPQGLDLLIELRHAVHGIEHHHLGAETLPALRGLGPELRVGGIHAQPSFEPEGGRIPSE